jgi:hypothetical protein
MIFNKSLIELVYLRSKNTKTVNDNKHF